MKVIIKKCMKIIYLFKGGDVSNGNNKETQG